MRPWFTSKNAIVIASVMLAGYLLLILTVTNIGQKKLEESRYNELHLKVNHYAELLSNYFELAKRNLNIVSTDKTITTFFANKHSGMSMTYGLRASLFNVEKLIQQQVKSREKKLNPIFSRISLLALDGSIIADSEQHKNEPTFDKSNINILDLKVVDQKLLIDDSKEEISIRLSTAVYFNYQPIAVLIAEFDKALIISLVTAQEYEGSGSHIALRSQYGDLFIWDSLTHSEKEKDTHTSNEYQHIFNLKAEIIDTPFVLETWFESINSTELFTSKWFVLVISLLAIPVFLTLYYLFYIDRKNTLLNTKIANSTKRRKELSIHNELLEEEIKKRKLSEEKLAYQATHDSLTGLPNRSYSLQKLNFAIDCCERSNKKVLLMYIDLDNFKQINDTLGHAAGDKILKETSKRLLNIFRKTDTVARLSGDEFMVVIHELEDLEKASQLAYKVLHLFNKPFQMDKHLLHTSTSIGLAIYPNDANTAEALLKNADMALYKVKGNGRNNFNFYESKMNDEVNRKVTINIRLHKAIKEKTLGMYYQPLIDLSTQKIIGAEALMRWIDSELGFVPPDEFIAIAEQNNLIEQLGSFALHTAAEQAAKWQTITPLQMAVNFSSVQFRNCEKLLAEIQQVLLETGLPANKLDVEVTESLLINQEGELFDMLKSLRDMGVELSIDDFGTGYSALSYLQKFSFTKLKIDRAFIMNLINNKADQSLVTAIIAMAKALNLKVVAEGIEEDEQKQFLVDINCEYGQGYLFSPPITADKFEALLRKQANSDNF